GAGGVAGCTSIRVAVADDIIKYQVVARLSDPRIADGLLESSDEMAAAFEAQERIQALERELEGLERQVEEGELSVRVAGAEERWLIREIVQLRPKTVVRFPGDKARKRAGLPPRRIAEVWDGMAVLDRRELVKDLLEPEKRIVLLRKGIGRDHRVDDPLGSFDIPWLGA